MTKGKFARYTGSHSNICSGCNENIGRDTKYNLRTHVCGVPKKKSYNQIKKEIKRKINMVYKDGTQDIENNIGEVNTFDKDDKLIKTIKREDYDQKM